MSTSKKRPTTTLERPSATSSSTQVKTDLSEGYQPRPKKHPNPTGCYGYQPLPKKGPNPTESRGYQPRPKKPGEPPKPKTK